MSERAAFYARVSTARQEQEQTIGSQLASLEQEAARRGWSIPKERRYIDDGFSGTRLDRPGLDALRDAAADGLLDVVLIHCPDRLARSYIDQHVVLEELTKRGVRVHFVERPVSACPEDQLLLQMQGVIAEYERAKLIERTRRGRLHKVRSGQLLPFTCAPYGYAIERSVDTPQGVVVINEVEAAHVRAMYRWVLEEGLSARQVAKRLNQLGIRPRRARAWRVSPVYNVLTNPAYTGMAQYGKRETVEPRRPQRPGVYRKRVKSSRRLRPVEQRLSVAVPALVDEATQQKVREQLKKNWVLSPRRVQYDYLLRSLVVCGTCGRRMDCVGQRKRTDPSRHYVYYSCNYDGPPGLTRELRCRARRVRADALDALVWQGLTSWLQRPELIAVEVHAWQDRREDSAQLARDQARLEGTCRSLQGQIERLVDAYQQGAIEVAELKARRERLETALQAAQGRLASVRAQQQDGPRLEALGEELNRFAAALRVGLEELDFTGRQRLVRLLVERVVVTGEQVTVEHVVPLSGRFCPLRSVAGGGGEGPARGGAGPGAAQAGAGAVAARGEAPGWRVEQAVALAAEGGGGWLEGAAWAS